MITPDELRVTPGATASYHPGWGVPEYSGWRDEQLSWKTACCVGDWSFLWDVIIEGPDALQVFADTAINSFASFDVGQAKHIVQCNNDGKVIAEGILLRLDEHRFATQGTPAFYSAYTVASGRHNATWRHNDSFQFQVAGPNALQLVEDLADEPVRDIGFMRFRQIEIAGCPVLALRQGMSGEIGFELHGDASGAQDVMNAILQRGADYGIRRLGNRTALINHLEACFPTGGWHFLPDTVTPELGDYGAFVAANFNLLGIQRRITGSFVSDDVRDYMRSPVELGWAKSIKFDHDFPGRAALEREVAEPVRTVVTLAFHPDDVLDIHASYLRDGDVFDPIEYPIPQRWIVWADEIHRDGRVVGISTVPGYSLFFRKVLALAYIEPGLSEPGTEVEVLWGNPGTPQRMIRATVGPAPYKPDKRRSDLTAIPAAV